jgi:uncharacterized YigZ family protein
MLKIFCQFKNSLPEQIATVSEFNEFIYKEKSSSFIAQSHRIDSEDDFYKILSKSNKKYYDASHFCFAYRLVNGKIKYSDDGEPHGTAGVRILNAIDHFNLVNTAVIVIRYFGGTKLGVGLLGKAYYKSAEMVLEKSEIINLSLYQRINFKIQFSQIKFLHKLIKPYNILIEESYFTNYAFYKMLIKKKYLEKFITDFQNYFQSTSEIITSQDFFYIQL